MTDVIVHLGTAMLCIAQHCYPALVGPSTPVGKYTLVQRQVSDPLYNGSVLQFAETNTSVFAIHRVWLGKPSEHRMKRIKSPYVSDRVMTNGCINVTDDVYNELLNCCQGSRLVIQP